MYGSTQELIKNPSKTFNKTKNLFIRDNRYKNIDNKVPGPGHYNFKTNWEGATRWSKADNKIVFINVAN